MSHEKVVKEFFLKFDRRDGIEDLVSEFKPNLNDRVKHMILEKIVSRVCDEDETTYLEYRNYIIALVSIFQFSKSDIDKDKDLQTAMLVALDESDTEIVIEEYFELHIRSLAMIIHEQALNLGKN